jgi:hypothetical protein
MSQVRQSIVAQRCPLGLLSMPLELIIEIMTYLDRVSLESLMELLDTPFPGVLQYVTVPSAIFQGRNRGMKPLSLADLVQSYSKINIVDIVGMKSLNDIQISQMCEALSMSINHITISRIENLLFRSVFNGKRNRILKLINSLPDSSKVIIKDSELVGLNDDKIDLRRTSLKNIGCLDIRRCGIKGGNELEIEDIGKLKLQEVPNELIESIDLEAGNVKALYLLDTAAKLENKTINTQFFRSTGDLDLQNVRFTGSFASFVCVLRDVFLNIRGLEAPNLYELKIVFRQDAPPEINLNAPLLHKVQWHCYGTYLDLQNVRKYQQEELLFLQQIRELDLMHFYEPLYRIDLHRLTKLSLECHQPLTDLERVFPSLKELVIFLTCGTECAPLLQADNLESLKISTGVNFRVDSLIPTVLHYPKLQTLSFENCVWCFLTRTRVQIILYWMKWQALCDLKVICCCTSEDRCFHGWFGF